MAWAHVQSLVEVICATDSDREAIHCFWLLRALMQKHAFLVLPAAKLYASLKCVNAYMLLLLSLHEHALTEVAVDWRASGFLQEETLREEIVPSLAAFGLPLPRLLSICITFHAQVPAPDFQFLVAKLLLGIDLDRIALTDLMVIHRFLVASPAFAAADSVAADLRSRVAERIDQLTMRYAGCCVCQECFQSFLRAASLVSQPFLDSFSGPLVAEYLSTVGSHNGGGCRCLLEPETAAPAEFLAKIPAAIDELVTMSLLGDLVAWQTLRMLHPAWLQSYLGREGEYPLVRRRICYMNLLDADLLLLTQPDCWCCSPLPDYDSNSNSNSNTDGDSSDEEHQATGWPIAVVPSLEEVLEVVLQQPFGVSVLSVALVHSLLCLHRRRAEPADHAFAAASAAGCAALWKLALFPLCRTNVPLPWSAVVDMRLPMLLDQLHALLQQRQTQHNVLSFQQWVLSAAAAIDVLQHLKLQSAAAGAGHVWENERWLVPVPQEVSRQIASAVENAPSFPVDSVLCQSQEARLVIAVRRYVCNPFRLPDLGALFSSLLDGWARAFWSGGGASATAVSRLFSSATSLLVCLQTTPLLIHAVADFLLSRPSMSLPPQQHAELSVLQRLSAFSQFADSPVLCAAVAPSSPLSAADGRNPLLGALLRSSAGHGVLETLLLWASCCCWRLGISPIALEALISLWQLAVRSSPLLSAVRRAPFLFPEIQRPLATDASQDLPDAAACAFCFVCWSTSLDKVDASYIFHASFEERWMPFLEAASTRCSRSRDSGGPDSGNFAEQMLAHLVVLLLLPHDHPNQSPRIAPKNAEEEPRVVLVPVEGSLPLNRHRWLRLCCRWVFRPLAASMAAASFCGALGPLLVRGAPDSADPDHLVQSAAFAGAVMSLVRSVAGGMEWGQADPHVLGKMERSLFGANAADAISGGQPQHAGFAPMCPAPVDDPVSNEGPGLPLSSSTSSIFNSTSSWAMPSSEANICDTDRGLGPATDREPASISLGSKIVTPSSAKG